MGRTFKQIVMDDIKPSDVFEQNRETIRRIAAEHNTTNPRVFGSVLKGRDMVGSDLDILVDRVERYRNNTRDFHCIDIYQFERRIGRCAWYRG